MFRFANPYYLLLLVPMAAALWFVYRPRAARGLVFAAGSRLPATRATWRTRLLPLLPLLYIAGLALAVFALARPQTLFSRVTRHTEAIAIEMVVDCSGSMEALDFSTRDQMKSRLAAVKETFAKFIEKRPDDLIGLVTFGGYATTRVPLTVDHAALLHTLQGVEVPRNVLDANGQIMNQEESMTAIGDALATACGRLEHGDVKSRIVVLLTDGESNTGIIKNPEDAAKVAKAMGIRIYTIGVGSTGNAPFLVKDPFGRDTVQYAQVSIDEDLLRRVAAQTRGQYFNVKDPHGLARAMDDINKLEKTRIDTTIYNQYNELFFHFLAPAIGLLMLGAGLNLWIRRTVV